MVDDGRQDAVKELDCRDKPTLANAYNPVQPIRPFVAAYGDGGVQPRARTNRASSDPVARDWDLTEYRRVPRYPPLTHRIIAYRSKSGSSTNPHPGSWEPSMSHDFGVRPAA